MNTAWNLEHRNWQPLYWSTVCSEQHQFGAQCGRWTFTDDSARCDFGLGLAGLVLFCETRSCHARRQWSWGTQKLFKYYLYILYSVLGTSLLWGSTVAFTYLKVKSAKCLCLLPVFLVLLFWSWSCKQRSWSWSWCCYFGLGLGLGVVILVFVLVL